ncbi:antirestriction protein [Sphingomonas oryzagri]
MKLSPKIEATLVPDDKRLSVLPDFFGFAQMLRAEAMVYGYMTKLSIDYTGGYWHYYKLDNGGFYMAPAIDTPMRVEWFGNGYEGTMSSDAAGIVATLFAVNQLAAELGTDAMIELYHALLDFGTEHAEQAAILSAID